MLTITDIKTALRIDGVEDDFYLDRLKQTAESYIRGAVDDYDRKRELSAQTVTNNFGNKADVAMLAIVAELWEHRVPAGNQYDYTFAVRSLITQLQYDTEFDDVEGEANG